MTRTALIYSPVSANYKISETHPLRPNRLELTHDILTAYGAFSAPGSKLLAPEPVTDMAALAYHSLDYVDAVKRMSRGEKVFNSSKYNIIPYGDNPPYEGMYDISLLAVGGSLLGARLVYEGEYDTVFNITGGYHHAQINHASGFCIFNDIVIAIKWLTRKGLLVCYVDIDAHHADGVQNAFRDWPRVLDISLHESGKYLFPGTGEASDVGVDDGEGYTVNIPFEPDTTDEVYLEAFRDIVPPLVNKFKPDVLVTQLGCDTNFRDPLTHMKLTTQGYTEAVRELKKLCPKWLAVGGGGYDVDVVGRSWALAYGVMMGREFPDDLPKEIADKYGIKKLRDSVGPDIDKATREHCMKAAHEVVAELKRTVFPVHGLK
jgi:acetoin utilization protein AcuC